MKYDITWKDHKLERGPVEPADAAGIVVTHLRFWPDDPIWLTPNLSCRLSRTRQNVSSESQVYPEPPERAADAERGT